MADTILITGAAGGDQGATGNHVVRLLVASGATVRALVHREDERSRALRELGAEIVVADFLDPDSIKKAMGGVRTSFFAYPVQDGLLEATAIFVDAARRAGLEAVVNLSQMSASTNALSPTSRRHFWSERMFDWSASERCTCAVPSSTKTSVGKRSRRSASRERFRCRSVRRAPSFRWWMQRTSRAWQLPSSRHLALTWAKPTRWRERRSRCATWSTSSPSTPAGRSPTRGSPTKNGEGGRYANKVAETRRRLEHLSRLWQTLVAATQRGVRLQAQPELIQKLGGQPPRSFSQFLARHGSELEPALRPTTSLRTSRTIQIERLEVLTPKRFADVVRELDKLLGVFDAAAVRPRVEGGEDAPATLDANAATSGPRSFMRMATLDHGELLALQGHPTKALRYLIGHPLVAANMTIRKIGAGFHAPLSLLVAEHHGGTRLEYDRPSTLLDQFGDEEVDRIGRDLDEKLASLVASATAPAA